MPGIFNQRCCPSPVDFEVAISPTEFFESIGVLIVEGRIPEISKNGRRTGTHSSWPITKCSQKFCCQNIESSERAVSENVSNYSLTGFYSPFQSYTIELSPKGAKLYDHEICKLVSSTRTKIKQVFEENQSLYIEVLTSPAREKNCRVSLDKSAGKNISKSTLLETWEVKILERNDGTESVNVNMVLQAVRSYLHFSQLSAWWNATQGIFPHFVVHRITSSASDCDFMEPPVTHTFPLTEISKNRTVQIQVMSLPRMHVSRLRFPIQQDSSSSSSSSSCHNGNTCNNGNGDCILCNNSKNEHSSSIENESAIDNTCNHSNNDEPIFSSDENEDVIINRDGVLSCCHSSKRKDDDIDTYCSSYCRKLNCQQTRYVGEKLIRFDVASSSSSSCKEEESKNNFTFNRTALSFTNTSSFRDNSDSDCSSTASTSSGSSKSGLSRLLLENGFDDEESSCVINETITSLPAEDSKPKSDSSQQLLSGNGFVKDENLTSLLEDFGLDCKGSTEDLTEDNENENTEYEDEDEENEEDSDLDTFKYDHEYTPNHLVTVVQDLLKPNIKQRRPRSKSVSPNFASRQQPHSSKSNTSSKPIAARRLAMVMAATVPVFNQTTGLPLSSSPAPIKKPRRNNSDNFSGSLSKSTSLDDLQQPCLYGLSKSAPIPSNLLGNFEESILNGRMPANGTLQGFFAELGASGTFCPKHVTLPMEIQYFSLSDDNAPSPYLGRIVLQDKNKRRRYRVPRKGTIQLTIFNPNKTVVKVFVVLYNFEDMPKYSRTFVRQKIVSDNAKITDLPTLHYLIHLSFVSSKSSHIYLHTDIRVLFRQRPPDEPLRILTHGPSDPKYTYIVKKHYQ